MLKTFLWDYLNVMSEYANLMSSFSVSCDQVLVEKRIRGAKYASLNMYDREKKKFTIIAPNICRENETDTLRLNVLL